MYQIQFSTDLYDVGQIFMCIHNEKEEPPN